MCLGALKNQFHLSENFDTEDGSGQDDEGCHVGVGFLPLECVAQGAAAKYENGMEDVDV